MFVTLSDYKKRCDSVIKIAQEISKAYNKERMKKLIIQQIDKKIGDKTLESINNFRKKNSNLSEITIDQLKDIILRNLKWNYFWCDINGLKETISKHANYCMKNTYYKLLLEIEANWFRKLPEVFNNKESYFIDEKRKNPKEYYSSERNGLVEDAIRCLNAYNPDEGSKFVPYFVCAFSSDCENLIGDNFDNEIYGVRNFYSINREPTMKEVKAGFFKKEMLPPNLGHLIFDSISDADWKKINDGFEKMEEYGVVLAGSHRDYWEYDYGDFNQLQFIDWVCDNSFRNSMK